MKIMIGYLGISSIFILFGIGMVALTMDGGYSMSSNGKWLVMMVSLLGLMVTTASYLTSCFHIRKQLEWKEIGAMVLIVAVNLLVMCFYGAFLVVLQLLY